MKFFWKIFIVTMFVSMSCLSLGSYFLIETNFDDGMNQEIKNAYQLCELISYSLSNEVAMNKDQYQIYIQTYGLDQSDASKQEWIKNFAKGLEVNNVSEMAPFRISNQDKEIIYSSFSEEIDNQILQSISAEVKGYVLNKSQNKTYIQTAKILGLDNETYYIETLRDVTHLFESQELQYQLYIKIMVAMFILGGTITAIISKFLMKPVVKLTKVATEISKGHFDKRIDIDGADEISLLSHQFNNMSGHLEEKIKELENEIKKQELFIGAFSHELKTPLTSIIGYSDMLRSKSMSPENISSCANYIFTEGKRLETLSMRLLDIIVLRRQSLYLREINSLQFFDNIKQLMVPLMQENNINYEQDIEETSLYIEPELMKTVCINIIDNARKALDKNGDIKVTGKVIKEGYKITIQDNGRGMETADIEKIMLAFYRVESSRSRQDGGAGLGLAICDEILKLHHAEIQFESEMNMGTTVTIQLRGEEL